MSPLDYDSSRHGVFELVLLLGKHKKFEDPWTIASQSRDDTIGLTFFCEKRGMTLNNANAIEGWRYNNMQLKTIKNKTPVDWAAGVLLYLFIQI